LEFLKFFEKMELSIFIFNFFFSMMKLRPPRFIIFLTLFPMMKKGLAGLNLKT